MFLRQSILFSEDMFPIVQMHSDMFTFKFFPSFSFSFFVIMFKYNLHIIVHTSWWTCYNTFCSTHQRSGNGGNCWEIRRVCFHINFAQLWEELSNPLRLNGELRHLHQNTMCSILHMYWSVYYSFTKIYGQTYNFPVKQLQVAVPKISENLRFLFCWKIPLLVLFSQDYLVSLTVSKWKKMRQLLWCSRIILISFM